MTQAAFHRRYAATPTSFRAELIDGVVTVLTEARRPLSANRSTLSGLMFLYQARTPGTESAIGPTTVLGPSTEVDVDLVLRRLPAYGGATRTTPDGFLAGPPELVAEIDYPGRPGDLTRRRAAYAAAGVPECLIYIATERRLRWFDLAADHERSADNDGVMRVRGFPGLWIDTAALAARRFGPLMATLEAGLATPAHADFVRTLAERNANRPVT